MQNAIDAPGQHTKSPILSRVPSSDPAPHVLGNFQQRGLKPLPLEDGSVDGPLRARLTPSLLRDGHFYADATHAVDVHRPPDRLWAPARLLETRQPPRFHHDAELGQPLHKSELHCAGHYDGFNARLG